MPLWRKRAFIATGLIPVLGLFGMPPDTTLLIYSLYVLAWFAREPLTRCVASIPGPPTFHLFLCCLVAGSLTETFAWMNNYFKAAEKPALFHPQLFADLILGIGFYGGWALAWWIALRWYRFSLAETFLVTGFQGIFFEQLGQVFLAMLRLLSSNPALSVVFGLYVFAVHGAAVGLAMNPVLASFDSPRQRKHWSRFVVVIVLMVGFDFAGSWLIASLANLLGGLPPKRSIIVHPFW